MMKEQDNDDDFVRYIQTGNKAKSGKCCTWKACWVSTCVTWAMTSVAAAITIGVLIGKHYILVTLQDPKNPDGAINL
jgi:hypothetical protein